MKNLIFCSASFHLQNYPHNIREKEYYYCFKQLIRMLPENFEIVICDNTIKCLEEIENLDLKQLLQKQHFFILERNIGKSNIGMGELDELIFVEDKVNFKNYDKVIYWTSRRIVTNPWIFEKVNAMKKEALLCNPPLLALRSDYNFNYYPVNETLYNDMFFCLSSKLMLEYTNYSKSKINYNLKNRVGSEQNLYNFINEKKIDYEWLEYLGLIRIDYKANNEIQLI